MTITFVCTANASRSAMAESVLKELIKRAGIKNIRVFSCGTDVEEGQMRNPVSCQVAKDYGFELNGESIPANKELLTQSDIILPMAELHRKKILNLMGTEYHDKVLLFNEYAFGQSIDLPDPYMCSKQIYYDTFDIILDGCRRIMCKLSNQ